MSSTTFDERVSSCLVGMGPAEQRVARVFRENREEVLYASAASLAAKAETSDATVVRTAQSLGFKGMNELRQFLAAELKQSLSITSRLTETLREIGDDLDVALNATLDIHVGSIENLRRDITPEIFRTAVELIGKARRVVIFGIGPSSAIGDYLAMQLGRFGIESATLAGTGLLFADDLRKLRSSDVLVAMAYSRVYHELAVLLDETDRHNIKKILLTDSLGAKLRDRVDLVLPVARGRADMLSMHTATLGLIEALLVGIAASNSEATIRSLDSLNALRERIVGKSMDIESGRGRRQVRSKSKRRTARR